jgi:hypothetical protein
MLRALAGALALVCVSTFSHGKWENVADEWPDITQGQKDWFIQQHNGKGMLCCSEADGHPTDWDIKDGHYWAVVEGEWRQIPEDAVVDVPNPVQRAVVWFSSSVTDDTGKKLIRCFIPGPGA